MLTVSRANMLSALALSSSIVERRNTIPILANVLFSRSDAGRLQLRMTDLDIELQVDVEAKFGDGFAAFTVQANMLHDIIRKLPDGADCTIWPADADMKSMKVKCGRSLFSLQVLPEHDFPDSIMAEGTARFEVPAKAFADALAAVSFAISTEETRYYLNGVYCHATDGGIMLVATDGHRLAKRIVMLEGGAPGGMPGVIIPRKTVGVLAKLLLKDGAIDVSVSDAKIGFRLEGRQLASKIIDGIFPDYQRVVPSDLPQPAEIHATALKAAVDRVSTIASDRGRAMRFAFAAGTLTLNVSNPDAGSSEEHLDYAGDLSLETGFNSKYVLEALAHLPDGTVTLAAADAGSPAVLRADGDHVENLVVLMPMRV